MSGLWCGHQKYNVISYDSFFFSPHIIFCLCIHHSLLSLHINPGPLFHLLMCHISEAWSEYWYSVLCCFSTDITHLVRFHFHSLLEKILWQGFSLPPVSWWESWPSHTRFRDLSTASLLDISDWVLETDGNTCNPGFRNMPSVCFFFFSLFFF